MDGLLTRRQLGARGWDSRRVQRALAAGTLRRVARGVYAGPTQQQHERLRALALSTGALAAGPSAALLQGCALLHPPRRHHLCVPPHQHRPRAPGCVVRRSVLLDPGGGVDGCVSALDAVVQCARWLERPEAVVVADSALGLGLVGPLALAEAAASLRGPGSARVRAVLSAADGRAESPLETLCRLLLVAAGLAPSHLQRVIYDRRGRRIVRADFVWEAERLVVETDGEAVHSTRSAVARDRAVGNALELAGYRLLRFTWADVVHRPDQVVEAVRTVLEEARR